MADSEQIRLALVLNGGVSLAVWMGGVTHEIDLLRRASRSLVTGSEEDIREEDRAAFELWREVLGNASGQVLVDVIAGTSAGGLNGAFLAAAIGRGAGQFDLRKTWKEDAALTHTALLRNPPPNSVLSGDFFKEAIDVRLKQLTPVHEAEPVTLFITATALDGLPEGFTDGFGDPFDVADHRRLYRFQHDLDARAYREADGHWADVPDPRTDFLDDGGLDRLALAARASAGYPVAFAPVDETDLLPQRVRPNPQLPGPRRDRASCVIDGGVLNNAPFGPVLEAIADRKVEGPVRRIVVYVVPSSGVRKAGAPSEPCESTPWTSVLGTALQYPTEADFRTGVADLSARMRADFQDRQLALFQAQLDAGAVREHRRKAEALFAHYREGRITEAVWKARQVANEAGGVEVIAGIPQQAAETILANGPVPIWVPETAAELGRPDRTSWAWGIRGAERLIWVLVRDLELRLRNPVADRPESTGQCARMLANVVTGRHARDEEGARRQLADALPTLSRCARAVRAMEDASFDELRNADPADRDPNHPVANEGPSTRINSVYQALGLRHALSRQVETAVTEYTRAVAAARHADPLQAPGLSPEDTLSACLNAEVLTRAFAPQGQLGEYAPKFEFLRLGPDEHSPLYPLDQYAELGDRKLYGIRLNHFGAFADEDWRASDFTWGRLDAAHHLLRLFLPHHQDRETEEPKLHAAILAAEITKDRMLENLKELAAPNRTLFENYLRTERGRATAHNVIEAVLHLLVGPATPLPRAWAGLLWGAFGMKVSWGWLRPSRWVALPARWFWWHRIVRKPAAVIATLALTAVLTLTTFALEAAAIGWLAGQLGTSCAHSAIIGAFALPIVLALEFGIVLLTQPKHPT